MAVIRTMSNPLMKGKIGDTTYYVSDGRQIARQAKNNSNYGDTASRTPAQQDNRVKWSNLVNLYKASKTWMRKAFETRKPGQTDYNKLMSINVPFSTISLPKSIAAAGGCVVEAYMISQGSLPSIAVVKTGDQWYTNIALGSLDITDTTTVKEFSEAVVAYNKQIKYGMQISFVSYMQDIDDMYVPRVTCTLYEVTLSKDNTSPLRNYLPDFCSTAVTGNLGTNNNIAIGAFAYILSAEESGKLLVSTQQLVTNNADLISQYASASTRSEAVGSYGVQEGVILSPITENAQEATAKPVYLQSMTYGSTTIYPGQFVGKCTDAIITGMFVTLSQSISKDEIDSASYTNESGTTNTIQVANANFANIYLTKPSTVLSGNLKQISIKLKDERVATIDFKTNYTPDPGDVVE